MNKQLLVVLIILAVVAGVVVVPKMLKGPAHQPPAQEEPPAVSSDTQLTCAHCGATFSAKDTKPMPNNQTMVMCPSCKKATPRRMAGAAK